MVLEDTPNSFAASASVECGRPFTVSIARAASNSPCFPPYHPNLPYARELPEDRILPTHPHRVQATAGGSGNKHPLLTQPRDTEPGRKNPRGARSARWRPSLHGGRFDQLHQETKRAVDPSPFDD